MISLFLGTSKDFMFFDLGTDPYSLPDPFDYTQSLPHSTSSGQALNGVEGTSFSAKSMKLVP